MSEAPKLGELVARPSDAAPQPGNHQLSDFVGPNYRRIRRIGSGGMADVYEVEHVRLGSHFAAKILRPGRAGWESAVRRFLREARLLARLKSDHLVRVVDVSSDEHDPPFYVMELLEGQDVRVLLQSAAQMPVSRALKIATDACVGLSVAHANGLVHRDLKPENLFITHRDSGEEVCKLLDFGVSKGGAGATTTEAGGLIGTVAYMAPEQVESAGTVTARADVYSLGAILYELLTGRPPHAADTVERLLFKILSGPIEPIRAVRGDIPAELARVVERALSRDPAKRYANAHELADALRHVTPASAALAATLGGELPVVPSRKATHRQRLRTAVAATVLGTGLVAAWLARHTEPKAAADGDQRAVLVKRADDARATAPQVSLREFNTATAVTPDETQWVQPSASPVATTATSAGGVPRSALAKRAAPNAPQPSATASASIAAHPAVPKIEFELQNPYAH